MPFWKYMQGNDEGKRASCVWHRRAGKDLVGINLVQVKSQERIGMYWHMLPTYKQGRAIVWNGFTRDGRKFLDHFHPSLVASTNATEMRVTFTNGSIYQVVGTDDIDSLVGTNPIGVVFSEYSLHDPGAWNYIRPILAENGGWAVFIYTARGNNHGKVMIDMAQANKSWFAEILVAGNNGTKRENGLPVISDEVINEERAAGMPEEMIQQEFYCSFEAPFVGAYYGSQMMALEKKGQILDEVEHDPKLLVDTHWDLGVSDGCAIWFTQQLGTEVRVIDYYEASGEGLPHYAKVLLGQIDGGDHRGEYTYGRHFAPPDIAVKELGTGRTRIETAKSLGIKFRTVRKHDVDDGIEAVRNILPTCWFNKQRCARGLDALRAYRKDWDDKNKCFRTNPLHDWSSHAADAFRYFAMSGKTKALGTPDRQDKTQDEHDYLRGS